MKNKIASVKACPFIPHMSTSANNLEMNQAQLTNKHNSANVLCLTNACMAWIDMTTENSSEKEGYCKLLGNI